MPLAVSKVTSSMIEVERFYSEILLADEVAYAQPSHSLGRMWQLWDASMVIRFVESKADTVRSIENVKKATHNASYASPWCGTDRYYDNHYAYSPVTAVNKLGLGAIASRARYRQTRWHCESSAIYLWEPTGDMVYVTSNANETARSGPAVDYEHDPAVIEDLAFCEDYSTVQAAMCTQGYCDGSGIAVVEADDDC